MNFDPKPCSSGAPTGVRLLRIKEVMSRLQVSRSKLFELFAANELARVKLGASTRVRTDALDAYIDRLSGSNTEAR